MSASKTRVTTASERLRAQRRRRGAAEFREIALGQAAKLDGRVTQLRTYERERSDKYRADVKRFEDDLKLLSDERDCERAADRPPARQLAQAARRGAPLSGC